jgi:hypothetical protein
MAARGQASLFGPSPGRVQVLAGVLAGMRWPGAGNWQALRKEQRAAAEEAARLALGRLGEEPD